MNAVQIVRHQKFQNTRKFQLRLPSDFYEKLKDLSATTERSMNLVINEILQATLYPKSAGKDAN